MWYMPLSSVWLFMHTIYVVHRCGLVALSIASSMMTSKDSHGSSHLSALLQAAQESKMTLRGEMFSADNMARLSTEFYHMPADVTTSVLSYPEELVKCLLQESPILVPYPCEVLCRRSK